MGSRNVSPVGMAVMVTCMRFAVTAASTVSRGEWLFLFQVLSPLAMVMINVPRTMTNTMKKTIGNTIPNKSNTPAPSFFRRFFSDYRLPHFYFLHKIFQKTFLCVRSSPVAASNAKSRRQTARGFSKEYV